MLLGEHINMFYLVYCLFAPLTEYFFSDGTVVELLEGEEDEDDDAALDTHR
jgi:hypothetical protein